MSLDPQLITETKEWLTKAAEDLRAAKHAFGAEPPLFGDIVFHCQQATEKALKGFLTWHSHPFRKTHSIESVGEQCLLVDSTLKAIIDRAVPLTEYAWKYRYPGESADPDEAEAQGAIGIARDVFATVLERLPGEVRP